VALALLCACGSGGGGGGGGPKISSGNTEISFPNIGNNGIFDPSITQDATTKLWMAYSEVNFPPSTTGWWHVGSRIASSNDNGSSWADAGLITAPINIPVAAPYEAVWQQETSHIAFDTSDADSTRRWKMLWHRYAYVYNTNNGTGGPAHQHGWISLKSAGSPNGLASATERKLFTGYFYDTSNDATIGAPEFPLAALYPTEMGNCAAFAEPGMLPVSDGVYVVLRCAPLPSTLDIGKIVLLKCTHSLAKAFNACTYKGNFLLDTEAPDHGAYDGFSAPDLVKVGAKNYLIVTPTYNDGYRGCLVFEVSNLEPATLVRDGMSKAVVVKSINLNSTSDHFGACGYHAGATASGVIHSEVRFSNIPNFHIFASRNDL